MKIGDPGGTVPVLSSPSGLGGFSASAASQWKEPVRVATTAAITLATGLENGDSIDGVTLGTGDRVLVMNQAAGAENGIYVVNATGAPDRASDADTGREIWGAWVYVITGTAHGGSVWYNTNTTSPTIDTTALTFAQFTGSAGTFATTADIADVAATESAGAATTVPRGDHVHRLGITTTRGDIITRGASDNQRLALGTDGKLLASDGTDAVWETQYRLITAFLDGGGATLTTGVKLVTPPIPFAGQIEAAYLDIDADGAIKIDIGNGTTWAGSAFSSICASAHPEITATGGTDVTFTDTSLSGWTKGIAVGDRLTFNIETVTAAKWCMVGLKVRQT